MTAYGILSRGLLSGSKPQAQGDFRVRLPRFIGANLQNNERLVATLRDLAVQQGVTPVQLVIAWVLAKGDFIVPLIGSRTRQQLRDSLGALRVQRPPQSWRRWRLRFPYGRGRNAVRRASDADWIASGDSSAAVRGLERERLVILWRAMNSATRSRLSAVLRDGHFWIPLAVMIGGLLLLSFVSNWSLR